MYCVKYYSSNSRESELINVAGLFLSERAHL